MEFALRITFAKKKEMGSAEKKLQRVRQRVAAVAIFGSVCVYGNITPSSDCDFPVRRWLNLRLPTRLTKT